MGEPGLSMGLVTTCSVAVDLETRRTLFQSMSIFCSFSWATAGNAHVAIAREANKLEAGTNRNNERITLSSMLNGLMLLTQVLENQGRLWGAQGPDRYTLLSFRWAVVRGCHLYTAIEFLQRYFCWALALRVAI